MRKIFAFLCAVALLAALAVPAIAQDTDLSWSERLALREQLSDWNEWQPVEVPEGVWVVGEDIPAGLWAVTCESGDYGRIAWGVSLNESGTDIDHFSRPADNTTVYSSEFLPYEVDELTTFFFQAVEGHYVVISDAPLTFTIPEFAVPETAIPATTEAATEATTEAATKAATEATQYNGFVSDYVVNISSGKIHIANRSCTNTIKESNRKEFHCTVEELEAMGYEKCGRCW